MEQYLTQDRVMEAVSYGGTPQRSTKEGDLSYKNMAPDVSGGNSFINGINQLYDAVTYDDSGSDGDSSWGGSDDSFDTSWSDNAMEDDNSSWGEW